MNLIKKYNKTPIEKLLYEPYKKNINNGPNNKTPIE